MKYSKETLKLVEMCFSNGEPRATSAIIGEKYKDREGNTYKITEETEIELHAYLENEKAKIKISKVGKTLNLTGVR